MRNRINGSIPPSIASLSELASLNLSNNKLKGALPSELAQIRNLTSLKVVDSRVSF
ncbi:putative non-specific serine/threonine protein kinase [Helianthus anomalus]